MLIGTLRAADWPSVPATKHAYLEIALSNQSGREIDQTGVYFGERRCTAGILVIGSSKTYLGWQQPITTNAVVRWRDSSGTKQEKSVGLVGAYDPKADGVLTFTIGVTNVSVDFKRIDRR